MRPDKVFSYLNAPFARAFFLPAPLCGRFFAPAPCAGAPSPCGRFFVYEVPYTDKNGRSPSLRAVVFVCRPRRFWPSLSPQTFPRVGRAGYGLCSRCGCFRASAAPAMVSAPAADVSARRSHRLWFPLPLRTFPRADRTGYGFRSRCGRFRLPAAPAMVSAPAADVSVRRSRQFLFSSPSPALMYA